MRSKSEERGQDLSLNRPFLAGKDFYIDGKYPATHVERYINYRPYLGDPKIVWGEDWINHGPLKRGLPKEILQTSELHKELYDVQIKKIDRPIVTRKEEQRVKRLDPGFAYVTDEEELRRRACKIYIGRFWEFVTNCIFGGEFTGDAGDIYVLKNGGLIVPDIVVDDLQTIIESKATKESLKISDFQLERYGRHISEDLEQSVTTGKNRLLQVQYALWLYDVRRPMKFINLDYPASCEGSLIGMMRNSGAFGIVLPFPAILAFQYSGGYYKWPRIETLSNGQEKIVMSTGRSIPKTLLYDLFINPEKTLDSLRPKSRLLGIEEPSPVERAGLATETISWRRFQIDKITINGVDISVPPVLIGEIVDRNYYRSWADAFTQQIADLERERSEEQTDLLWKQGLGCLSGSSQEQEKNKIPDKDISIIDRLDLSDFLNSWRDPEKIPF